MTFTPPPVPASVREWNRKRRATNREVTARVQAHIAQAPNVYEAVFGPVDLSDLELVAPQNVRDEYAAYVAEWNRRAAEHNRQVQARKNAREVAKVRNAACPRCSSTHAGEC